MSSSALADKDVNAAVAAPAQDSTADVKSMEYHRQVLQSKIDNQSESKQYISPSDNIQSPCTAKLSAFRNKQVGKAKPKSLFARASSKKIDDATAGGGGLFGSVSAPPAAGKGVDENAN
ncbi:hypothetical protein QBC39DRAFT_250207 [Podospora conica]|nr:hypothetical protein QBC39DRAFT_250207 [Schizothecium conicum]